MKKCPPGVICFETAALFGVIIIILLGIIFYFYTLKTTPKQHHRPIPPFGLATRTIAYPDVGDVYRDPYVPPLKDDSVRRPPYEMSGIPVNVRTHGVDTEYRQVGLLTRSDGSETILPLMGRPLYPGRDKWQYYTMSDKNNIVKLPVSNLGKSCTGEYGCDSISTGDGIHVEGYNSPFKVTMYDNATLRYI